MPTNHINTDIQIATLQSELHDAYLLIAELQQKLRDAGLAGAAEWNDLEAIRLADAGMSLRKIAVHFGYSPNSATTVSKRIEEARKRWHS